MGVNEERVTFCELAVRETAVDATKTFLHHCFAPLLEIVWIPDFYWWASILNADS